MISKYFNFTKMLAAVLPNDIVIYIYYLKCKMEWIDNIKSVHAELVLFSIKRELRLTRKFYMDTVGIEFSEWYFDLYNDPYRQQEILNTLNTCSCCSCHQKNRPKKISEYNWEPTPLSITTVQKNKSCKCFCRSLARWFCFIMQ
tara:strand:+ start:141 stop:572 length:432 start_codon:yes stop_codon:yes gene_type:complete